MYGRAGPQNPLRSGGKKQVLTDCPSRNRINVPDLKICMAQKLAAQLAAQRPNTSLVHMQVQKVTWLCVRLCNILHREKPVPRGVVKWKLRKGVFEQTCLKTRFSVPRCQKEPASRTLNKNLTPAADCTRPERRAKAKPRCLKQVCKTRAASRAPRRPQTAGPTASSFCVRTSHGFSSGRRLIPFNRNYRTNQTDRCEPHHKLL